MVDLQRANTDTLAREYATYCRAHRELAFGWNGVMQSTATLRYFEKMLDVSRTTERGVLRGEICAALRAILPRVMGAPGSQDGAKEAWAAFEASDASRAFWASFQGIYTEVSKWAQKSAHSLFSYQLLAVMLALSLPVYFQDPKREDVLAPLLAGLGYKEQREASLITLHEYYRYLRVDIVTANPKRFEADATQVLAALFPRRERPKPSQHSRLCDVPVAMARCGAAFTVGRLEESLRGDGLSEPQKSIFVEALARIGASHPETVAARGIVALSSPLLPQP